MQVTIEGKVIVTEGANSEKLWEKRDYHAQATAWAIETMPYHDDDIGKHKSNVKKRFEGSKPPKLNSWVGFAIEPNRMGFWNTGWKKNKKRECLTKMNGEWTREEIY